MGNNYHETETYDNLEMTEAIIKDQEFFECEFNNCTFEEMTLKDSRLSGCIFVKCTIISLRSKDSTMKNCTFENCNLIGVHWQELFASGGIAGPFSELKNCLLKYNSFVEMNLKGFDFTGNTIQNAVFEDCCLVNACFNQCRLEESEFAGCDLKNADFREARGYRIDILTNKMKQAQFSFPEVVTLLDCLGIKVT